MAVRWPESPMVGTFRRNEPATDQSRDTLLEHLGTRTIILTGIAANICVLFSANDAYMRDFSLCVPRDCTVSNTRAENAYALKQMKTILKADVRPSTSIKLAPLEAHCE